MNDPDYTDEFMEKVSAAGKDWEWPAKPYGDNGISKGLMQLLPQGFLKNFITLSNIIRECGEDSFAWFPDTADDLFYQIACVSGEAGELINEAKKSRRGTHTFEEQKTKIEEESIDVLIYLANIWYILGTNVTEVYNAKRAANLERFGPGSNRVDPAGE